MKNYERDGPEFFMQPYMHDSRWQVKFCFSCETQQKISLNRVYVMIEFSYKREGNV